MSSQVTIKGKSYYYDGYLQRLLNTGKQLAKEDWDLFIIVDGQEGCLSGDTIINCSRATLGRKYSLKKMYNQYNDNILKLPHYKKWDLRIPTYVRSFNGKDIRLHKIKNVVYSGKKELFQITLKNGCTLKATQDHEIMTRNGFKEVRMLNDSDDVMCDTLKAKPNGKKRIKFYDIALKVGKNHPYASSSGRVEVHRLCYEAKDNNLHFNDYIDALLNYPERLKNFKFINPAIHDIHHVDGNHYNNSPDNLIKIPGKEHKVYHSMYENFSQGQPSFSNVTEITKIGYENVYDIICEEPYRNFVANGIVVHNCGKSEFAAQLAFYLDHDFSLDKVAFSGQELIDKIRKAKKYSCIVFDEAYRGLKSANIDMEMKNALRDTIAECRQKNLYVIIVMPNFMYLEHYTAVHRARALFHVYKKVQRGEDTDKWLRGYWAYFDFDKKQDLYFLGRQKNYRYVVKSNCWGRFTHWIPYDMEEYRKRKLEAFERKEKKGPSYQKFLDQRNLCIYYLKKHYKLREIVDMFKGSGYPMAMTTIREAIDKAKPDI